MKVILSPHPDYTAGYKFDKNFSRLYDYEIIDLKSKNKVFNCLQFIISLPFIPFLGVFGALTFVRVMSKFNLIRSASDVCISRSLFPSILMPYKCSVLYHNIEFLYYLEEAKASRNFIKKFIYFHQSVVLRLFELKGLGRNVVHCLSIVECRFLKLRNIKANFNKRLLFSVAVREEQFLSEISGEDICFFGAFNNVRNVVMAEKLQMYYPKIRFFGRNGDLLPKNLQGNYHGEISDFSTVVESNVLVMIEAPKAGVQTKVVDWLENGGRVYIPSKLRRKMWGRLNVPR